MNSFNQTAAQPPGGSAAAEKRAEHRYPRCAIVSAHRADSAEVSRIRADLIDSSSEGLGLQSMIPIQSGIELTVQFADEEGLNRTFRCRVQHCTKQDSGLYHVGARILSQ